MADATGAEPMFRRANAPVPYVVFADPGVKQAWPNVAACWSPARPVTGTAAPRTSGSVSTTKPDDGRTSGSIAIGTPMTSQSQGSQARRLMSKRSVRLAFDTSVAWTRPPDSRQSRNVSIVPKQRSPASARARRSGDESRIWATFVPEK